MNICMLSKSDESGGGASRVAATLSENLRKNGIPITQMAKTGNKDYYDISGNGIKRILYKSSRFFSKSIGLPDILTTEYLNLKKSKLEQFDLFHCHDTSSAISPFTLKMLSKISPVIWTFHDCSPFTGGCIQPLTCSKYINGNCSNCPQLGRWPLSTNIDLTGKMQSLKIGIINQNIHKIICPSIWIADEAARAGVSENLISIIYNSTDTSIFSPNEPTQNKKLCILISSLDLNSPYKGGEHALDILNKLNIDVDVIIIGKNGDSYKEKINPRHGINIVNQTFDQQIIATYYRKADLLLYTSIGDNCPLTIIEALSSGVPVIAFKTGGIPELISHNANGWLSHRGDIENTVSAIESLHYNRSLLSDWKKNARNIACKRFDNQIFLNNHLALYEAILK